MTLPAWEEQGYHIAGMLITFLCAWMGIILAVTVDKCSKKATSILNLFAGGVLFAGGMVHLLHDSLYILSTHSPDTGSLLALIITSVTYIVLFVLHTSVSGHFGQKLQLRQKKTDRVRLLSEVDEEEQDFTAGVRAVADKSQGVLTDEADFFIAALQKSGLRSSALLMTVLSLHSFLAGLAFGSQPDPAEEFKIMIPIAAHKSIAAMALTLTFKSARVEKSHMAVLLLIFSCSTPLGTICGIIVSASFESALWTGVCLAIAAGTFIFVTLNDILPTEILKDPDLLLPKCAALVLGFALMSALAFWI